MTESANSFQSRVRELFDRAVELPPREREALLDAECGENAALRAEVDGLLRAFQDDDSLLDVSPLAHLAVETEEPDDLWIGERVGAYHVEKLIARGGMGAVYEAVQEHPRRRVAIKILQRTAASRELALRFERESQILAHLQHSGIASIFDAGIEHTAAGELPYFAMELVEGRPLDEYLRSERVGLRERLQLFLEVCVAVEYAHRRGIIHRDLKPANIVVEEGGRPKILDFGVARATESDVQTATLHTEAGQLIGTLPYMSPEQASGDPAEIDSRTDVYSLGVILYEMLAGVRPHDLDGKNIPDALWTIREGSFRALSAIDRSLRGELETIAGKALQKDKDQRYGSATELAADIRRFLANEPILARPPSAVYQVRKLVARYKLASSLLALVFLLSIAFAMVATIQADRTRRERDSALKEQGRALRAESLATEESQRARQQSYVASLGAAQAALEVHRVDFARGYLDRAPEELRGWEWSYLSATADQSLETPYSNQGRVWSVAIRADGKLLAFGNEAGTLTLWDIDDRRELASIARAHTLPVRCVEFSPDGAFVCTSAEDRLARVWDAASLECVATLKGHRGRVEIVIFASGGDRLFTVSEDGVVVVWDWKASRIIRRLRGLPVPAVWMAVSPNEERFAVAHRDNHVVLWDLKRGQILRRARAVRGEQQYQHRWPVAFSPDGDWLATGSHDGEVNLWRSDDLELVGTLQGHTKRVWDLEFDSGGRVLATCSSDRTVRLWDVETRRPLQVYRGHEKRVFALAIHPDDQRIVTACDGGDVKIWDLDAGERSPLTLTHPGEIAAMAVRPDGEQVAAAGTSDRIVAWLLSSGERTAELRCAGAPVRDLAFDATSSRLASAGWDGKIRVWNLSTAEEEAVLEGHGGRINAVRFGPRGLLASCSYDRTIRFWSVADRRVVGMIDLPDEVAHRIGFRPDGRRLASVGREASIRIWDVESCQLVTTLRGSEHGARCVEYSPDGALLATAHVDHGVRIWSCGSGAMVLELSGHAEKVLDVAFSPDGARLATVSADHTAKVWSTATGEDLLTLEAHDSWATRVAFSPDGSRLLTAGLDFRVRVWDSRSVAERALSE